MNRALFLLLLLTAAAACKGSSSGGAAQLAGTVLNTSGTPIAGAAISAGNTNGASDASGNFSLNLGAGTVAVSVTAVGYYPLDTNLPVAPGMNNADFTLETCIVGTANCTATPTPTPTATGTPVPGTYNVTANFTGVITGNLNNSPAWTGSATLNGSVRTVTIGNAGQNVAQAFCLDNAHNPITNPPTANDTCAIIWYGVGAGTGNNNDVDLELHIQGDLWQDGFVQIQPGTIDLLYFESASNGQGPFSELAAASSGQFVLVSTGYLDQQPAELDGGYFNIPNLP